MSTFSYWYRKRRIDVSVRENFFVKYFPYFFIEWKIEGCTVRSDRLRYVLFLFSGVNYLKYGGVYVTPNFSGAILYLRLYEKLEVSPFPCRGSAFRDLWGFISRLYFCECDDTNLSGVLVSLLSLFPPECDPRTFPHIFFSWRISFN